MPAPPLKQGPARSAARRLARTANVGLVVWRAALLEVQSFSIALAARIFVAIVFVPYLAIAAFTAFAIRRAVLRKRAA